MKLAFFLVMVVLAMTVVPAATASKEDEAKRVAVALVYANVNARYGTVWAYLHPRYQRVTTRAFWESCKRKLAEERGVEFFHIRAIDAYPDRVTLPLLGTTRVIAVTLQAKFVDPHQQGVGMASDTHLWVKVGSEWKGLWTSEQYRAYKAHRCPAT
jgi:hypothetical protein